MNRLLVAIATAMTLASQSCTVALGGGGAAVGAIAAHTADSDKSEAALLGLLAGSIVGLMIDIYVLKNLCIPITPGSCEDDD